MAGSETELIERYFRALQGQRADVMLGIGDDAALLRPPPDQLLVLTCDALVEGVHFLAGESPRSLGHRTLAVNLSDIAAMGALPRWALLSMTLPVAQDDWLREFVAGFAALAQPHEVALVGGNLSRGPLSMTLTLAGSIDPRLALRRDRAVPGDDLYVSGSIGDAAAGRQLLQVPDADAAADYLRERFQFPTPRVRLGQALAGVASACIDVSDGLYIDAQRLLQASHAAAVIELAHLPLSPALRARHGEQAWRGALAGGEDYELCFTAAAERADAIAAAALSSGQPVTRIGRVQAGAGLRLQSGNTVMQFSALGFDHFRD